MVRVVSQSFSHPRSRHSSGETDLDLAMRADSALSTLRAKRTDFADCESSSDSFWDSEFDFDQQDHLFGQKESADDEINGNETSEKSDVYSKRKERRRERNKVSAQAYRQRRRQVNVSTQQELTILEEKNKRLLKRVHHLEQRTEQAKQYLKGQLVSVPDFLYPVKTKNSLFSTTSSSSISCEPQKTNTTASDQSLSSPCPSLNTSGNSNSPNWGFGNFVQNNYSFPNGNNSSVNANLPAVSPMNLNAIGSTAVSDTMHVSDTVHSPSISPGAGVPLAMPKQNLFNANHFYKIPIHHPKVLRPVPEIPSNFPNDEEEANPLTLNNQSCVRDSSQCKNEGAKASCDEFAIHNGNSNMNLNMNERVKSHPLIKDDKIWNGSFHMNPLKPVDMNDNEKPSLSKPHLQNSPQFLLHPNSFVQLIIANGENSMPSQ